MISPRDLLTWDPAATGLASSRQIYLDNNATSPIAPIVVEAMSSCWQAGLGNPASQHQTGQACSRTLHQARETLLQLLGADLNRFPADQLILTSGGTEANNWVFAARGSQLPGNIVLSGLEHPSVSEAAKRLAARGCELRIVPVETHGRLDPQEFAQRIDTETRLVSIMLANNETGVIQPVAEVARLCRQRDVFSHCDAVQAVGKMDVSFRELGCDALTFAPHKFHGPVGIGGLVLRAGVSLDPLLFGGFQQQGLRPGTENVALAVGAATALAWYLQQASGHREQLRSWRDEFERLIRAEIPEAVIVGSDTPRLPQTSCIAFPDVDRQALVLAADVAGVACATGSACASGSSEPSPVLQAMGLEPGLINGSLRFSFGLFNDPADAAEAAKRISLIYGKLRQ